MFFFYSQTIYFIQSFWHVFWVEMQSEIRTIAKINTFFLLFLYACAALSLLLHSYVHIRLIPTRSLSLFHRPNGCSLKQLKCLFIRDSIHSSLSSSTKKPEKWTNNKREIEIRNKNKLSTRGGAEQWSMMTHESRALIIHSFNFSVAPHHLKLSESSFMKPRISIIFFVTSLLDRLCWTVLCWAERRLNFNWNVLIWIYRQRRCSIEFPLNTLSAFNYFFRVRALLWGNFSINPLKSGNYEVNETERNLR